MNFSTYARAILQNDNKLFYLTIDNFTESMLPTAVFKTRYIQNINHKRKVEELFE